MALTRRILIPLSLSATALALFRLKNSIKEAKQINTKLEAEEMNGNKFSTMQIISAFVTSKEAKLREDGFTPISLYQSGKNSFLMNQKIRARMQYKVMLRLTPNVDECFAYEKSGNILSLHGYSSSATKHWLHAFNQNHRPYEMTHKLGQHFLINDQLDAAQKVFEYQVRTMPNNALAYNELGVTRFMLATRQKDFKIFYEHKYEALKLLKQSSVLDRQDRVSKLNYNVADFLTFRPVYKHPWRYLQPKMNVPTSMIDALIIDLDNNKVETRGDVAPSLTVSTEDKGQTTINPSYTHYTHKIPRLANELAILKMYELKTEEYDQQKKLQTRIFGKA